MACPRIAAVLDGKICIHLYIGYIDKYEDVRIYIYMHHFKHIDVDIDRKMDRCTDRYR